MSAPEGGFWESCWSRISDCVVGDLHPGDTQRDVAFQVTILDVPGPNRALASLAQGLRREAGMRDSREPYLGLMRATERECWHLANH